MNLKGKRVYITGSNRGIGFSLAKEAAKRKSNLILVNRKVLEPDKKDELAALGAQSVEEMKLDLLNKNDISAFLEKLKSHQVDVFFNNAGLLTGGLLENQEVDDIYNMLQVNLNAVIHICRGLIPIMIKQKSGYIVNNSSVSGKMFLPCANTYAASKAGVVALTESISQELQGTGVKTLLMITPGVKTDMFDDIPNLYGDHLDMDLDYISSEDWAKKVFNSIEAGKNICGPSGSTKWGVSFAHHFPSLFKKAIKSKFKR